MNRRAKGWGGSYPRGVKNGVRPCVAFLAALVFLAACVAAPLHGCATYDATLRALAGYRAAGKLNVEQIATVDKWRSVVNPICTATDPPRDARVLDILEQALLELALIERRALGSFPSNMLPLHPEGMAR